MHIGQVIREIRESREATLEEIAFTAETNASNLSRIERGTQGYSEKTLERIASALGVTVSELHARAEAGTSMAGKVGKTSVSRKPQLLTQQLADKKYSALNQENRELVDEFIS